VRTVFNNTYVFLHVTQCCLMYKCTDTWNLLPPSSLMIGVIKFWMSVHLYMDHTASYPRRQGSLHLLLWQYQIVYPLFVTISKQWITTRLHPVMGFYIIVSLFYLTIVICHFMPLFHPPFMWAVSWVNYINMLNELMGRGHWWCYAFMFFYERTVI